MPFLPGPIVPIGAPVSPDEIVRPTRVVFRHIGNRKVTSRLFPTAARAYDFAAEQTEVLAVQDVDERPPRQDAPVHRHFTTPGSGRSTATPIGYAIRRITS